MIQRIACSACRELIHPDTAIKNDGLCMPCKGGYREQLEAGKRAREQEREYEKSPAHLFWLSLIRRVHAKPGTLDSLSPEERTYYAVRCLRGEVFRGGFYQFFSNSGHLYGLALDGLLQMEAERTYSVLTQAKELLFGSQPVPNDVAARDSLLPDIEALDVKDDRGLALDALEQAFYDDPEELDVRCIRFALNHGLYASEP